MSYERILEINSGIKLDYDRFQIGLQCPDCDPGKKRKNTLNINTKTGYAKCFRCDKEFWRDKKNEFEYKTNYVPTQQKKQEKTILKPLAKKVETVEDVKLFRYFKKRGISKKSVQRMRIGSKQIYFPSEQKELPAIAIPYYFQDKLYACKYRGKAKDGSKIFTQEKDATHIFYGLDDVIDSDICIIVEGEIDKLSFDEAGLRYTVSVPNGGSNTKDMKFLDNSIKYLDHIKKFYLALDNDEVGIGMREELARRLGYEYCSIVEFPEGCKDANEVLVKYGADKLIECINNAKDYPKYDIVSTMTNFEKMEHIYKNGYEKGDKLGWTEHDKRIRWFKGIHTALTGNPQDGKSVYIDNVMIKLALEKDWKFGVFSPENGSVEIHKHRLAEILTGKSMLDEYNGKKRMTLEELRAAMIFLDHYIKFITPEEDVEVTDDYIFDQVRYLVKRYGIDAFILDPFSSLDIEESKETIKRYLNKVTKIKVKYDINFITVAHPTKLLKIMNGKKRSKNTEVPTGNDISDSRHWFQKVDVGLTWHAKYDDKNESTDLVRLHNELHVWKVKHKFMGKRGYCKFGYEHHSQRIIPENEGWDNNHYNEEAGF